MCYSRKFIIDPKPRIHKRKKTSHVQNFQISDCAEKCREQQPNCEQSCRCVEKQCYVEKKQCYVEKKQCSCVEKQCYEQPCCAEKKKCYDEKIPTCPPKNPCCVEKIQYCPKNPCCVEKQYNCPPKNPCCLEKQCCVEKIPYCPKNPCCVEKQTRCNKKQQQYNCPPKNPCCLEKQCCVEKKQCIEKIPYCPPKNPCCVEKKQCVEKNPCCVEKNPCCLQEKCCVEKNPCCVEEKCYVEDQCYDDQCCDEKDECKEEEYCPEPKGEIIVYDENIGFPSGENPTRIPTTDSDDCFQNQLALSTTTINYGSILNPSIAVNPICNDEIVAAWAQNLVSNGGELEIGIAHSIDGGCTWYRGTIPLQICMSGLYQRVGNLWLSYRADGERVFLIFNSINVTAIEGAIAQSAIVVFYSDDNGITWVGPAYLATSDFFLTNILMFDPTVLIPFFNLPRITADPNDCQYVYAVWDTAPTFLSRHSETYFSRSNNGGWSWFPAAIIYDATEDLNIAGLSLYPPVPSIPIDCPGDPVIWSDPRLLKLNSTVNNQIVVLPVSKNCCVSKNFSGDLLNFMIRVYAKPGASQCEYYGDAFPYQFTSADIAVIRSSDNGYTWTKHAIQIATLSYNLVNIFSCGYTYNYDGTISGSRGALVRDSRVLASYTVDPKTGYLYVVFMTDQFRADSLSQIALVASYDGGCTWTKPIHVNRTPKHATNPQAFAPNVAVNEAGFIAITYYDFRYDDKSSCEEFPGRTFTDYWIAFYKICLDKCENFKIEFVDERRLTDNSFIIQNTPATDLGFVGVGDSQGLVSNDNLFYEVHTEALYGPFNELTSLNESNTLLLDNNVRTQPFFSLLKLC